MDCVDCPYFGNDCDGECLLDDIHEDTRHGHEDWEIDPDMGAH